MTSKNGKRKTVGNHYKRHFDNQKSERCCENMQIEKRNGEYICTNCGMVWDLELVQHERPAYTEKERRIKKQNEPVFKKIGNRTYIGKNSKKKTDGKGNKISKKSEVLFNRLMKIQRSLVSSYERNLWEAYPKMNLICRKLNIPDHIKETAWKIYRNSAKRGFTQGRSIKGFVCASLYAAIRVYEFPRILDDLVGIIGTMRRRIINALSYIINDVMPEFGLKYKPANMAVLTSWFVNRLGLSVTAEKKALKILDIWKKKSGRLAMGGKDPRGFAAASIYIGCKYGNIGKITQNEICEAVGITEVTLRSRIKDIKKYVDFF